MTQTLKLHWRLIVATLVTGMFLTLPFAVHAQSFRDAGSQFKQVGTQAYGGQPKDIRVTVAKIIKYSLSLLGIVFTALIIYGGFTWMRAGGDETIVKKAKSTITQAVIGIAIVLLAQAISSFVIKGLTSSL